VIAGKRVSAHASSLGRSGVMASDAIPALNVTDHPVQRQSRPGYRSTVASTFDSVGLLVIRPPDLNPLRKEVSARYQLLTGVTEEAAAVTWQPAQRRRGRTHARASVLSAPLPMTAAAGVAVSTREASARLGME
jgi:hypothetical protein